jgi:iron(III) transport system permease protein
VPSNVPTNASISPALASTRAASAHSAMRMRWRFSRMTVFGLAIAALFVVPVLTILSAVFARDAGGWSHITSTVLPGIALNSFFLAFTVGMGVAFIGTVTAWLTATTDFAGRRVLEWALVLPLAMPAYVMAYAYTDALQYAGPVQSWLREVFGWQSRSDYWFPDVRSLGGAAAMLMFVLYPYVYMLARVAFLEQSSTLAEAGRTFGYWPAQVFFRISLPLARPAIAAGTALAVMETLADYGTVSYFGVQTFTTGIFNAWLSQGDRIAAAKLSALLLAFVILLMYAEHWARQRSRYFQVGRPLHTRTPLRGARAFAACAACAIPLLIGFVIPCGILIKLGLSDDLSSTAWGARFAAIATNSFLLATVTALIAVGVALALAYAARRAKSSFHTAINRLIMLGYAVPGAIIAVGVIIPVVALDHWLVDSINRLFGSNLGLILSGSVGLLIYAYLIRFLAVALQGIEAGLTKVTPHMDDAARSLGATEGEVLRNVHVPLLRASLITAGLLVFVDVMKELPATLVLRPFNFDTLAVHVYVLAKDERLVEAAWPALAIVLVGLVPVVMASRRIVRATRIERGR